MIDMESRVGRRIIGRIETGRNLEEALIAICKKYNVDACEVRITGILRDPILLTYKEEDGEFTAAYRVPGLATLVSLEGDISRLGSELLFNAKALLAWDDRGLPRVAAGQLKSASVHSVEYVLATFDDLTLERGFDPVTRLPLWTSITRKELPEGLAEVLPRPGSGSNPHVRKPTPAPRKRTFTPSGQPVAPGDNHREVPRDVAREMPRELLRDPRENQRELPRENQRELPRESHREVRENHREHPRDARENSREVRETPRENSRENSKEIARIVASMSDDQTSGPELRPALNEKDIEVVRRPPRRSSWAEVVSRSRELDEEVEEEEELEEDENDLVKGDVLIHPKLGRCIVLETDEDERVLVHRPGGGKAALARSHVKLYRTGTTDNGRAIYRVTITRP